jgi:ferredoxin
MGNPRQIGALVASRSSFACDLISAELIGLTADKVPTLAIAEKRGLCPKREDIELFGSLDGLIIEDFDNIERPNNIEFLSGLVGFKGKFMSSLFRACMASRPKLKKSECVGCRECFKICPAKAITMVNNKPKIDRTKCIRCFCCQEFCPKGALKVHRPIVAKIANKL